LKNWEDCLPFIEFAYIQSVHSTIDFSPFEIVYGFNPLTPLNLLPLPVNERTSLDGQKKVEMVKKLHESVRQHIEKKNEQYATKANKGHREVIFEPSDWVWVHMKRKDFQPVGGSSYILKGIVHFKSLRESIIMLTSWIFQVSITLVLHLMFLIFLFLM
jgi:hypothetical protein